MWNKNVQDWRRSSIITKPQAKAGSKACIEEEAKENSKTKEKIIIMVADILTYWKQLREFLFINLNLYAMYLYLSLYTQLPIGSYN
jgi:hypothetical protein